MQSKINKRRHTHKEQVQSWPAPTDRSCDPSRYSYREMAFTSPVHCLTRPSSLKRPVTSSQCFYLSVYGECCNQQYLTLFNKFNTVGGSYLHINLIHNPPPPLLQNQRKQTKPNQSMLLLHCTTLQSLLYCLFCSVFFTRKKKRSILIQEEHKYFYFYNYSTNTIKWKMMTGMCMKS